MARKWSNINLPGALHFVTGNFLDRLRVFTEPECCKAFLEELSSLDQRWPSKLIAYVLMPDHFHLISNPRDGRIREFIGELKSLSAGASPLPDHETFRVVQIYNDKRLTMRSTRRITILISLLLIGVTNVHGQKEKPAPACSQTTFAAIKPVPKLEYDCPEGLIESDDKILRLPERLAAISRVVKELEAFRNPAWWQADVDEVNACQAHGSAGQLTDEEKEKWKKGGYNFDFYGNHQMRLVLVTDPCYQNGYNGSVLFLLYRKDGKVFVSQLLNGYYSRVDNSVGIDFATMNGQQLIELGTANSMPPTYINFYFVIDPKTNRAVPKQLFKDGKKSTNTIYSAMLMNEPKDLGLPKNASELEVFSNSRLAPTFSAYEEDDRGKIESNGRKLRRIVYRWNGRFYARAR